MWDLESLIKGGDITGINDVCDCPKWGVSCMVVRETPEGLSITVDWNCPTMRLFKERDDNCKNLKHTIDKGGIINASKEPKAQTNH